MLAFITATVGNDLSHQALLELFNQGIDGIRWYLGLVVMLVLAGYGFSAGSYAWTWLVSCRLDKFMGNHFKHLEDRVAVLEKGKK